MARHVAKTIVASEIAEKCEVQLAYAIGIAEPVSVRVDTMDTSTVPEYLIEESVKEYFDLTPAGIIDYLDLRQPIYRQTSYGGHFGRPEFTWEKVSKKLVGEFKKLKK